MVSGRSDRGGHQHGGDQHRGLLDDGGCLLAAPDSDVAPTPSGQDRELIESVTPRGSATRIVGNNRGAGHERAPPDEPRYEAAGEQVDEEPLQGAHPEHELFADRGDGGSGVPVDVTGGPVLDRGKAAEPPLPCAGPYQAIRRRITSRPRSRRCA